MRPSVDMIDTASTSRAGRSSAAAFPPPAMASKLPKSRPAQKPRPSPESTTTRTDASPFSPSPASATAWNMAGSMAFSLSGRFRRTSATPSWMVIETRSDMPSACQPCGSVTGWSGMAQHPATAPRRCLAALALALCAVGACGDDGGDGRAARPKAVEGGELTVGIESAVTIVEPGAVLTPGATMIALGVFDPLTTYVHGEVVPFLAQSVEASSDLSTYEIELRRGVTFHDGTPLDAEAVVKHFDRLKDPATACSCQRQVSIIESMGMPDGPTGLDGHLPPGRAERRVPRPVRRHRAATSSRPPPWQRWAPGSANDPSAPAPSRSASSRRPVRS